jgi:hypothetical protein
VINDVIFCILIICQIIWGLTAVLVDVELAFLNGDLDAISYIECPDGIVREADVRIGTSDTTILSEVQVNFD